MRHLTYYLLLAFAIYVLTQGSDDPAALASGFFDWLGDGIDKTSEVVTRALGDAPEAGPELDR